MSEQTRDEMIGYLVRVEFADVTGPFAIDPELALSIGFRRHIEKYRELQSELEQLSNDEITEKYKHLKIWENSNVKNPRRPKSEGYPFNRLSGRADFDLWAKMAHWTVDEFVALSLGRNPKVCSWPWIENILNDSAFASEFAVRREICVRAIGAGQMYSNTIPTFFLAWAGRIRISVPVELVQAVEDLGYQIADWKTLYDQRGSELAKLSRRIAELENHTSSEGSAIKKTPNQSLQTRERNNLLKLVIGMAVGWYGYDPLSAKNRQTKQIADDLEKLGLSLSEDTIRKYLAEGKELLPGPLSE